MENFGTPVAPDPNLVPESKQASTNQLPPIDQSTKTPAENRRILIALLILAVVALGALVFWAGQMSSKISLTSKPSTSPGTSPTATMQTIDTSRMVFSNNHELWHRKSDGANEQLTKTNQMVIDYAQAFDSPLVAYITSERHATNPVVKDPIAVNLMDVTTQQSKTIFSLKPTLAAINTEFMDKIWDINFSQDGKLLAITTSQELHVYNTESGEITRIFSIPYQDNPGADGVFSYAQPLFSPDSTLLTLTVGYYEGRSSMLVNLETKQHTPLPYDIGYGGGVEVVGWSPTNKLLISDNEERTVGAVDKPRLLEARLPNLETTAVGDFSCTTALYLSNGLIACGTQSLLSTPPEIPRSIEFVLYTIDPTTKFATRLHSFKALAENTLGLRLLGESKGQLYFTTVELNTTESSFPSLITESIFALNLSSGEKTLIAE